MEEGRGEMEAKTGASCRVQVAGEARDGRRKMEAGRWKQRQSQVTGHRVQAAGFNLGPCILNLESPVGQREE
jgi:hypothetical protein